MMLFLLLILFPMIVHAGPRIVGGKDVDPARYPYYTFLVIGGDNGTSFVCGGSLMQVSLDC